MPRRSAPLPVSGRKPLNAGEASRYDAPRVVAPLSTSPSFLLFARHGGEGLPVVYSGRDEAGRLAAVELARFLSRLGRCRVVVLGAKPAAGPCIELVSGGPGAPDGDPGGPAGGPGVDAFRRTVAAGGVSIESATGRGLLFGAYDLLEDLGCRWYYPGPVGERVPVGDEVRLPHGVKVSGAALPGRSLILGHDLYLADAEGWVEWAARNRLNNVFLHEFPPPVFGGRPSRYWREALAKVGPLARRRGLTVEFGGHGLAALLPRSLFRSHPDFFRHDGRRRNPDHNLCPSSQGGLDVIRRKARAYFELHPGADVYHLWPDDIVGDGWCRCPDCASLSASDQTLLATNAVAEVLAEVAPGARLAFLVYHDTIEPPRQVRPRSNVALLYAPRERCYAHALDDPACGVNRDYYGHLVAGVEAASGGRPADREAAAGARASGPRVFEYYLDAVLFKSMLPPLSRVMARDLLAYRRAGAGTVGALMTSDRPWVSVSPNLWLFARLTWDPEADLAALVADFAGGRLGSSGLARYFGLVEEAFAKILELDGQAGALRMPGLGLLDAPPLDTLDFLDGPSRAREGKLRQLTEAADLVEEAVYLLAQSLPQAGAGGKQAPGGPTGAAVEAEWSELELVARQLEYLKARQEAVIALQPGLDAAASTGSPEPPSAREAIARAWQALAAVRKWGRSHLQEALARAQFGVFHSMWEVQLLHLERRLQGKKGRPRLRDVVGLGRVAVRWVALRALALGRRRPSVMHR